MADTVDRTTRSGAAPTGFGRPLTGGTPLASPVQRFFQRRMGGDLSDIRVHTDLRAAALARSVNARAFTVGRHIVFDRGQFAPATTEGGRLLAHELAHVGQQRSSDEAVIRRKTQRATADYLDSDLCYTEIRDEPTNTVLGRWVAILETPTSCPGEVAMTARFEMIGDWGLTGWIGRSGGGVKWDVNPDGISARAIPKPKREVTETSFQQTIIVPVTAESCSTDFIVRQLVAYRPHDDGYFAEHSFHVRLTASPAGPGPDGTVAVVDRSPVPTIRVDHCGKLAPSPTGLPTGGIGELRPAPVLE